MTTEIGLRISCYCGQAQQNVSISVAKPPGGGGAIQWPGWSLCHCDTCRHTTGLLCASYIPLTAPPESLSGTVAYTTTTGSTRHFCARCGCHIFRSNVAGVGGAGEHLVWEVATGVVASVSNGDETKPDIGVDNNDGDSATAPRIAHLHVSDTVDGGLTAFLPVSDKSPPASDLSLSGCPDGQKKGDLGTTAAAASSTKETLPASCHCGRVALTITRPSPASSLPRSTFSDLLMAYCNTPKSKLANTEDEKWWLRPGGRYLAGTCACRSCRLISGFEIQTWTFVPRANVLMGGTPVEFEVVSAALPVEGEDGGDAAGKKPLRSYESSPGVIREFCPGCGATVFWHDRWRPDVLDVSVGLLRAQEGARAEEWLDWWTKRVSFTEETENGREGVVGRAARGLIQALERGLAERKG